VIDETCSLKTFFCFWHEYFPLRARGILDVDFDQFAAWRLEIGLKPETRAFVSDESVSRVEIVEQFYDRRVFRFQIFVVDAVLRISALVDGDDQVVAVFSN
jgi:hypothetical protein